ncbi:hypothetical protein ISG33_06635 [Glaciecola sp. MH2013]|uniref:hypothetical protein n=1 Tax=Glaciecola sp. MH2013 TaxID=2785524 RepID=UPI00189FD679|nr:hypothetical protein [Glaciecola sp. MH2013]MBF7073073.1 hypothetical protein [Glaciecola sp. MH2013]
MQNLVNKGVFALVAGFVIVTFSASLTLHTSDSAMPEPQLYEQRAQAQSAMIKAKQIALSNRAYSAMGAIITAKSESNKALLIERLQTLRMQNIRRHFASNSLSSEESSPMLIDNPSTSGLEPKSSLENTSTQPESQKNNAPIYYGW